MIKYDNIPKLSNKAGALKVSIRVTRTFQLKILNGNLLLRYRPVRALRDVVVWQLRLHDGSVTRQKHREVLLCQSEVERHVHLDILEGRALERGVGHVVHKVEHEQLKRI